MTFTVNNFYIASCSDLYSVPHGAKKYHSSLSPMGNVFFFCFPKLQAELGTDTCHSNLLRILFFCLLEVFFFVLRRQQPGYTSLCYNTSHFEEVQI